MVNIKFFKIDNLAITPSKSEGNIGLDITYTGPNIILLPGERQLLETGLKYDLEPGYAIILKDRSGNASKKGMHILAGVLDSSYRGEVKVCVINLNKESININTRDKICQAIIVPDYKINIVEVYNEWELSTTDRGENGFGSSGN